jgi:hypothetical protein
MIIQLLTQLQAAETVAIAVVKAAEMAYEAARKNNATAKQIAGLDPGRHQVALGAVQTAIAHVETIMGEAADAREEASGQAEVSSSH